MDLSNDSQGMTNYINTYIYKVTVPQSWVVHLLASGLDIQYKTLCMTVCGGDHWSTDVWGQQWKVWHPHYVPTASNALWSHRGYKPCGWKEHNCLCMTHSKTVTLEGMTESFPLSSCCSFRAAFGSPTGKLPLQTPNKTHVVPLHGNPTPLRILQSGFFQQQRIYL